MEQACEDQSEKKVWNSGLCKEWFRQISLLLTSLYGKQQSRHDSVKMTCSQYLTLLEHSNSPLLMISSQMALTKVFIL